LRNSAGKPTKLGNYLKKKSSYSFSIIKHSSVLKAWVPNKKFCVLGPTHSFLTCCLSIQDSVYTEDSDGGWRLYKIWADFET
jgi:hypothetical protein